jgi:hypothetical protein
VVDERLFHVDGLWAVFLKSGLETKHLSFTHFTQIYRITMYVLQ